MRVDCDNVHISTSYYGTFVCLFRLYCIWEAHTGITSMRDFLLEKISADFQLQMTFILSGIKKLPIKAQANFVLIFCYSYVWIKLVFDHLIEIKLSVINLFKVMFC